MCSIPSEPCSYSKPRPSCLIHGTIRNCRSPGKILFSTIPKICSVSSMAMSATQRYIGRVLRRPRHWRLTMTRLLGTITNGVEISYERCNDPMVSRDFRPRAATVRRQDGVHVDDGNFGQRFFEFPNVALHFAAHSTAVTDSAGRMIRSSPGFSFN